MLAAGVRSRVGIPRNIVLVGAIALALLILPVIIIATREACARYPGDPEGSLALGATPARPLAADAARRRCRASRPARSWRSPARSARRRRCSCSGGGSVTFDPNGLLSRFTAMPIQIYNWTAQPAGGVPQLAAAAIIVLLAMLLAMNALAIYIRNQFQRSW